MKGKILVVVLVCTAIYGLLRYHGYFDGKLVQIRGSFSAKTCEAVTIDLMVISVSDSSVIHLLNKKISAELTFRQSKLNNFIQGRLAKGDSSGFLMVGYPVEGRKLHCSGSTCFTVRKIKTLKEEAFTEL